MVGHDKLHRRRLVVAGQVQGVGFRPFVHRLATELGLTGLVVNDHRGVTIEVQGPPYALNTFACRLGTDRPPLAEIHRLVVAQLQPVAGERRFKIRPSKAGELADAQVTVDTAPCPDCLAELNDPADSRHLHPFITCTNCGPRYSIVTRIPYDRPNTTMADFAMCGFCARQYGDPGDRRFHAQPIACPNCGPVVWLVDTHGRQIHCRDPIAEAATLLRAGKILAIKGLGGFHLVCRADDDHVVRRLRRRKRREAKPFALMVADLVQARTLVDVVAVAEALLTGPIRPIVLLGKRAGAPVASAVAEGLDTFGVMLPCTPLEHLLFREPMPPLVMTSGNLSQEPLVKDNDAAIAHFGTVADALLVHNRRIERRIDDSVVQIGRDGRARVLRRARGYAPRPFRLSPADAAAPAVLAVGGELKSTICLFKAGRAVLSEHIGDLKDGRTYRSFIDTINHLEKLFDFTPQLLAADRHRQYLSSEYAARRHRGDLAGREALPIVCVQHHHAHIAACMAENARSRPVIGLACDGVGYGDDHAVWGCEILLADLLDCRRLGHLRYVPLIGGDAAAVETCRPAMAVLWDALGRTGLLGRATSLLRADDEQVEAAVEMLTAGVNCPPSSSLGRWFDAVAHLVGVADANLYEGQAPMKLEAIAAGNVLDAYPFRIAPAEPFQIDLRPMVVGIVEDLNAAAAPSRVAAKFHNTVAAFLAASARLAREQTGVNTAALSGGCFANRYLAWRLAKALTEDGFEVLTHSAVPCNDGGIALGQAVVAAATRRVNGGNISLPRGELV